MLGADRCPDSPTDFCASECDLEASKMGMPLPPGGLQHHKKNSAWNSRLLNIDSCLELFFI